MILYGKNDFEVSKILATDLKIILNQNNVERQV